MCSKNQFSTMMDKLNSGLPTCTITLPPSIRRHLPDIGNWTLSKRCKDGQECVAGNYNKNIKASTVDNLNPPIVPVHKVSNNNLKAKLSRSMPVLKGHRGWCGCLKDDEPPEICVVEGVFSLETLGHTAMPTMDELDAKFAELVEELDLTAPNKLAMLSLPPQKKWQIYCSRKSTDEVDGQQRTTTKLQTPESYVENLQELTEQMQTIPDESLSLDHKANIESQIVLIDALKTALRTSANSFVIRFIEFQGLPVLLEVLSLLDVRVANSPLHTSLIGCIKALMNNSTGRSHVLAHHKSIDIIGHSLATDNVKTKIAALEILGAVCLVPGGHKKVLTAMLHFQKFAAERTRFATLVSDLDRSTGAYRDDVNLKTAIMSFINAILNYGPGQENFEFRLHLRFEFLMLGIQPVIDKLRKHENETLNRHLDFFEMVRKDDEKELAKKYNNVEHVDTKSAAAMFEFLRQKISYSSAYPHFLSLLQHMLLLPNTGPNTQHWIMFDRIVQQLVLQQDECDPDGSPIKINVKKIVKLLAKEEELMAARSRAESFERENTQITAQLAKKEQELDHRVQEKEDLETSLARMRERLEKESTHHSQTLQKAQEAELKIEDLQHRYVSEQLERQRLERMVAQGSIPDDQKMVGLTRQSRATHLSTATPSSTAKNTPTPPPPMGKNILPPPPPAPTVNKHVELVKKNVPQSRAQLKSFNWSKLPDSKVQGTVWSELDESKMYTTIDLENIDKLFSAFQKNGVLTDGSVEDLTKSGRPKCKIVSVIDARRSQNCTILLSKLKMSDEEISRAILSMDSNEQLPIDMIEQLLKFTPSAEERALLDETEYIESLARADRFLYEISKIPHYEQRLRSLHYKKRFSIAVNDLIPKINSVMEASREVARSRRLRKLLELVLAVGNYMNRGARGNASGFRLASLNRLADTKSSTAKGTTLLHYLVQIVDAKIKDLLHLEEDIPHVKDAAKVNLGEMEKDICTLRSGIAEVAREIEFHRNMGNTQVGDTFLPVMRDFHAAASVRFAELDDKFQDMKTRFDRAIRLFGETDIQPDEFFGIFENFISSFMEAKHDNDNFKKRQEEEEKRAKQETELKKRTIERKSKKGLLSNIGNKFGLKNDSKGEFDDLISALRTGDVFGEDLAKFKRSRKKGQGNSTSPPRNSDTREDSRERNAASSKN